MDTKQLHERILYPVARVRALKAGGSGTIIYSKPNPAQPNEYLNFVLTCAHVVDSAIALKKDWDSVLKKKVEKEFLTQVEVETFDYVEISRVDTSKVGKADIFAYDKSEDLAILKLSSPKPLPYVAKLIPREEILSVKVFAPTWTCGCSLLHDPFANPGNITYLTENIDNKNYWMCNGAAIFGNSGGAVFLAENGYQIGVTARVTGIPSDFFGLGVSMDWMTWMNYMVDPNRIYKFFDDQEIKFLYDSTDTYAKAVERREKKRKEALLALARQKETEPDQDDDYQGS